MTLADIATQFSSPLVHAPVIFILIRIVGRFTRSSTFCNYLSVLPIVWLLLCSMTYPSVLLVKQLEDAYPVIHIDDGVWRETEAIIVLACNHFEDEQLPFISRWPNCSLQRNLQAALMYKSKPIPIFLAGGVLNMKDRHSQAFHNKKFMEFMGVESSDIVTIEQGFNTETEIAALAPFLSQKSISLVTSASHLPRAVKYFNEYDIRVLPIPVEHLSRKRVEPVLDMPSASNLYRSERAIHEYLGLIYQEYFR